MPHINKQMASFFLTTKCNLRCVYCYNSSERNKIKEQSLPLHIAKAGIDYFFSTNDSRHIRFYGPGEPTQEFLLMKDIFSYACDCAGDKLSVEIQTNGCFNAEVREWMLNNINIIWVSFDGEPDIQNKKRPLANGNPTSNIIEENVRWLIKNKDKHQLMVGARVTMTNENIGRQKQMIDYFNKLGIKYIWTNPIFPPVEQIPVCYDKERIEQYKFNMEKYVDNYIKAFYYAKERKIFFGSFLTCNFDGLCSKHCRTCIPVPHFTTDGYISACDLAIMGKNANHMDCFIYGKWNEEKEIFDIDSKKVKQLQNRSIENINHCMDCRAKKHCGGYCMAECMNETGSIKGQKVKTCHAIRRLFDEIGITDEPYPYLHP